MARKKKDETVIVVKKRKEIDASNPPKKRRRTKKDNAREVDDLLASKGKREPINENLEQYQEYINGQNSDMTVQYLQKNIVEKDIAQLSILNLINHLKTNKQAALNVNGSKLDIIINRFKSLPGIESWPCFNVTTTNDAVPGATDYESKGDQYIDHVEHEQMVMEDEMIGMLWNQMHAMQEECGISDDIAKNRENYKYKKVETVSAAYSKDFLRAPVPGSNERCCRYYDEKNGGGTCKSFVRAGFCCREWVLPSMSGKPLPDIKNPCLMCMRFKSNAMGIRRRFGKKTSPFLLQDHQVITDQPGEYCSEHCFAQNDGIFGFVGPFPCHRRNRYEESTHTLYDVNANSVTVPGWAEKLHFFHVDPTFSYPP